MKNKISRLKHASIGFLCGAVCFGGIAQAAMQPIQVSFDKIKFFVQGIERSSPNGTYDNGGISVPEAMIYEGTTYVPIRKVSELLNMPVFWDGRNKAVSVGGAHVELSDASGTAIGQAELIQDADVVRIHLKASGLAPGKHGFHIHDQAVEGADFKTAGGHFNPEGKKHGHGSPEGHHLGDMSNLDVKEDGTVDTVLTVEGVTLETGKANSILGRSLIIHAKEDDGKTDPSGNSGDRVAGGNIPQ